MRQTKLCFVMGEVLMVLATALVLPSLAMAASKYAVLHEFKGPADGHHPVASLTFDATGNLYGTTTQGGEGCGACGTVFELQPNLDGTWAESVVYSFAGGADGDNPVANLMADGKGNFFGTTSAGGDDCSGAGCGVVFELSSSLDGSWTETVLYRFTGGRDGSTPRAGLISDAAGNLYGTTSYGGSFGGKCGTTGCGVVFMLAPQPGGSWSETVLHRFSGQGDGGFPYAGLTFDTAGNLYGTTLSGGDLTCFDKAGCGTVFELTPNTNGLWKEKVLHRFNATNGAWPQAGLIFDAAGNLYGTTFLGGNPECESTAGCGVVFELTPNTTGGWKEKVLHRFAGKDGAYPEGTLIFDGTGNLYGTTQVTTVDAAGIVFKLIPNAAGGWSEKVIHRFTSTQEGKFPFAGLIFDDGGNLYGTANGCSGHCTGVVFQIAP
jgi:uncharacterized repeat protein (TIGR03803 family)